MQISEQGTVSTPKLTEEQYFQSPRISNSDLGLLKYSPLYFKLVKNGEIEGISSSGFFFGSLVDCKVLTPGEFEDRYRLMPPGIGVPSSASSSYQETFCEFLVNGMDPIQAYAQAGYSTKSKTWTDSALKMAAEFADYVELMKEVRETGHKLYSMDDQEKLSKIVQSLSDHQLARKLLFESPRNGEAVAQLVVFFELYGIECRLMEDRVWIDDDQEVVYPVDLKTTSKPLSGFNYWYEKYDYHRQQAFYKEGISQWLRATGRENHRVEPLIVVVDTDRVHECKVLQPHPSYLERGAAEMNDLLDRLLWHQQRDQWQHTREYYENDGLETLIPETNGAD